MSIYLLILEIIDSFDWSFLNKIKSTAPVSLILIEFSRLSYSSVLYISFSVLIQTGVNTIQVTIVVVE